MKVCILGVGRSGTTALYSLIQEILIDQIKGNIDFVYEPFLWDKEAFNGKYRDVIDNFKYMNSVSIEGIYHHWKLPLFIIDPKTYKKNQYLSDIFQKNKNSHSILIKFVRANGRFLLLKEICPDCKFIFIIRNPIDVINSAIVRFSFYGSEFHQDDFRRFVSEVNALYGDAIQEEKIGSQIEKEVLYWHYMNKFALDSYKKVENKPLIICHEDYISNRRLWLGRICDFLEIHRKESYYDLSQKKGGSSTNAINLTKSEFDLLTGYMPEYRELLENEGLGENLNDNEIMAKYKNLPPKNARIELMLGRTPNHMNDRLRELERIIEQKNGEIKLLKQQLLEIGGDFNEQEKRR